MDYFSDIADFPASLKECVLAIGNFDGVHRGHQFLLEQAQNEANKKGAPWGVLTFEPHPRRLFRPDDPPGRLTPAPLKAERLKESGADFVIALPFNWNFASQTAEDFIQNLLIDALGARHIVIGADFRFGQLRKGDAQCLRDAGLAVSAPQPLVCSDGEVLSSSRARQALRHGEVSQANETLGWDWEIRGEVVKGDQRGRELGYPTANVMLGDTIHPAYGIYAAFVRIEGESQWHKAAVNIGIRPMFEVPTGQVEAHILDFDRDIYGKILHVRPVKKLRGEAKFDSLEALIVQIEKDCVETRQILQKES